MRHVKTEPHYPYSEVYAAPDAPLSMVRLAIKLIDLLPHGSGIDFTWRIEAHANRVECHNDLHAMDQNGYYAGYYPFTVKFTAEELPEITPDYVDYAVMEEVDQTYMKNYATINPWEED